MSAVLTLLLFIALLTAIDMFIVPSAHSHSIFIQISFKWLSQNSFGRVEENMLLLKLSDACHVLKVR